MRKHEAEQLLNQAVDAVVESGHPAADTLLHFRDEYFAKATDAELAIGKLSFGMHNPAVHFGHGVSIEEAVVKLALARLQERDRQIAELEKKLHDRRTYVDVISSAGCPG